MPTTSLFSQSLTNLTFNTLPDEVSLVSETSATLRTLVSLLLGRWGDIGRVVIKVLVSL